MEEKFLYHIWDEGHLKPELRTVSGKQLKISYQGQFNTNRGPDFCNVIIILDGNTLTGDVEIHANAYDWIAHNHHEDHHYNDVILHVVLENSGKKPFTIKQNGEAAEILELREQLSDDILKLLQQHQHEPPEPRSEYCDLMSAVDNDTLVSLLGSYGRRRFKNKVRRFNAILALSDFNQVLYEGIMEALGYDKNKLNLLKVAQLIPLREIRAWQEQGMTALELISVFCCSTTLIERCGKQLGSELVKLLRGSYETQKYTARQLGIDWQLFRIRPPNHPVYRLFFMCGLLQRSQSQGLLEHFMQRTQDAADPPRTRFKRFQELFTESTLAGSERLPKPGKNLIGAIYVNIYLPILYLFYDKLSDQEGKQRVLKDYDAFPPLQENHITKFMGRHLSESHKRLASGKSLYQQGLIELFHRFCRYRLCDQCKADSQEP